MVGLNPSLESLRYEGCWDPEFVLPLSKCVTKDLHLDLKNFHSLFIKVDKELQYFQIFPSVAVPATQLTVPWRSERSHHCISRMQLTSIQFRSGDDKNSSSGITL